MGFRLKMVIHWSDRNSEDKDFPSRGHDGLRDGAICVSRRDPGSSRRVRGYWRRRPRTPRAEPTAGDTGHWPSVTVQIPLYNERCVAAAVIDACAGMRYPRDRFDIQVLDDSTDETVGVVDERAAWWRSQGVTVTVEEGGAMLVNDVPTSEAELYGALEKALEKTREKLVILRGDRQVLLGQAVNILDLAQQAGATGIALATKPPPKKG